MENSMFKDYRYQQVEHPANNTTGKVNSFARCFKNYRYQQVTEHSASGRSESGCWGPSTVKLVQLCCFGILFPILWIVLPLYIHLIEYGNSFVPLAASETRTIDSHVSTVWCQAQRISMVDVNASFNMPFKFNTYLVDEKHPVLESLEESDPFNKSVQILNNKSKVYWGFYLLKGSKVTACTKSSSVKVNVTILEGIQNLLDCAYSDDGKNNLLGRKLAPSKMNDHHQSRIPLLHSTDWPDITYKSEPHPAASNLLQNTHNRAIDFCNGVVPQKKYSTTPDYRCDHNTSIGANNAQTVVYEASVTGYHYFIFNTERAGELSVDFRLVKRVFKLDNYSSDVLGERKSACLDKTQCEVPLRFASHDRLIVSLPDGGVEWSDTLFIQSECLPRKAIYLIFFLSLPFIVIFWGLI